MSALNVPVNGAVVNPPLKKAFRPRFIGGEDCSPSTGHGSQASTAANDATAGDGKKKGGKKAKAANEGEASVEKKGPSLSKQWADRILLDKDQPWFAEANHTSGGEAVYRWNGSYMQFIGSEEGASLAADWMDGAFPEAACASLSKAAWAYGGQRLRLKNPKPVQDMRRNIISCADVYLELDKLGNIIALAPDPVHGMTYALNIAAGTPVGKLHKLKSLPKNSIFRSFIEKALPDPKVRALVQEQCGMCLLPANYQMATWWTGAAGSGKSTLAELCKAMQRQVASIGLDELSGTFGLESLVGASLVVVDEVEQEKWAEGKWKSLVGGNGVSVNRKNEKALLSYSMRAKWIITSNAPPFVRDKSNGVWRRICLVVFENVVAEKEVVLELHNVMLEKEAGLILDWMLEGARELVKRGHFMPEAMRPAVVQIAKEVARNDCDSVRGWMKAFSVKLSKSGKGLDQVKSKDQVYTEYEQWCEATHQTALERRVFWKGLRGQLPGIGDNLNRRVNGKQMYFCNIEWTYPAPSMVALTSGEQEELTRAQGFAEKAAAAREEASRHSEAYVESTRDASWRKTGT